MKKWILFGILAPLLALLSLIILVYYLIFYWNYSGPERMFDIKEGEGFAKINARLHNEGFIVSKKIFYQYAKYNQGLEKFKVGLFLIRPGMNLPQIYELLQHPDPHAVRVTIPEGKNFYEIGSILETSQITNAKDFIYWCRNRDFLKDNGITHSTIEGFLYPETYIFSKMTPPKKIIITMLEVFRKKIKDIPFQQSSLDFYQTITLASIVEKETGAKHERPIIAGVFLNRLKKGMKLQSDPTTIYGKIQLHGYFDGDITKKDLLSNHYYNTYKIPALPPGPISNPGLESIKAVIFPKKHNFIFFVSKNDGTHSFSENYNQHLKSVRHYQLTRENREGKSWRQLKDHDAIEN
jgi:UPF0755 protein